MIDHSLIDRSIELTKRVSESEGALVSIQSARNDLSECQLKMTELGTNTTPHKDRVHSVPSIQSSSRRICTVISTSRVSEKRA